MLNLRGGVVLLAVATVTRGLWDRPIQANAAEWNTTQTEETAELTRVCQREEVDLNSFGTYPLPSPQCPEGTQVRRCACNSPDENVEATAIQLGRRCTCVFQSNERFLFPGPAIDARACAICEEEEPSPSGPEPSPEPEPQPTPAPEPDPEPEPQPTPGAPEPEPEPQPTPVPEPDPEPEPQPTPVPEPSPEPAPTSCTDDFCADGELCFLEEGSPTCCTATTSYGTFEFEGSSNTAGTFRSAVQAELSFSGVWSSDGAVNRVVDSIGRLTGTPFADAYGSSANSVFASVFCASANRDIVFTFDEPTTVGFGFALGDVDAENVRLRAADAEGNALTATELGFQSSFNYANDNDLPVWQPASSRLAGNGMDTDGASGWFQPLVPIQSLTMTCETITGTPRYQVWMASPQCQ